VQRKETLCCFLVGLGGGVKGIVGGLLTFKRNEFRDLEPKGKWGGTGNRDLRNHVAVGGSRRLFNT